MENNKETLTEKEYEAHMNAPLILHDFDVARTLGEEGINDFRTSLRENKACAEAIKAAYEHNRTFGEMAGVVYFDAEKAVNEVLEKGFPDERVDYVLATQVVRNQNYLDNPDMIDGRFSKDVKDWAINQISMWENFPFKNFEGCDLTSAMHHTLVDSFADKFHDITLEDMLDKAFRGEDIGSIAQGVRKDTAKPIHDEIVEKYGLDIDFTKLDSIDIRIWNDEYVNNITLYASDDNSTILFDDDETHDEPMKLSQALQCVSRYLAYAKYADDVTVAINQKDGTTQVCNRYSWTEETKFQETKADLAQAMHDEIVEKYGLDIDFAKLDSIEVQIDSDDYVGTIAFYASDDNSTILFDDGETYDEPIKLSQALQCISEYLAEAENSNDVRVFIKPTDGERQYVNPLSNDKQPTAEETKPQETKAPAVHKSEPKAIFHNPSDIFDCSYDYSIIADCAIDACDEDTAKALTSQLAQKLDADVSLEFFGEYESAWYRVEYNGEFRVTADEYGEIDGMTEDREIEAEGVSKIKEAFAELGHKVWDVDVISLDAPSSEKIHDDVREHIAEYHDRRRNHCLDYDG